MTADEQQRPARQEAIDDLAAADQVDMFLPVRQMQPARQVGDLDDDGAEMAIDAAHQGIDLRLAVLPGKGAADIIAGHFPMPSVDAVREPAEKLAGPARRGEGERLDRASDDAEDEMDGGVGGGGVRLGHE